MKVSHGRKKGNSDRREGKDGEKRNINKFLPILRSSDISPQENEPEPGRGSENNQKNLTKLMKLAITKNYQELEEFLNSMDPSLLFAKDYKGRTALDWARLQNNQMSINLISNAMSIELNRLRMENIGYVVSNEIVIKQTNQRLMQQLSDAYDAHDSHRILQILLDSQISRDVVEDIEGEIYFVDFQTASGDTALLRAAGNGWYDVVIELLAMGCDINKSNKYGHNPLTWACVCGHAEIVRTLLVKDAKFTHQTKELRTCLHYACLYLKSRVVSVIMDVLFEKFSMFRMISHPFTKYDPSRWKKYAEILDNFLMMRDFEDHTALDLIPSDKTLYDSSDVVFQTATHQVADHIRRKSTYKPINPFEKPDDFERLVKMGSGIVPEQDGEENPQEEEWEQERSEENVSLEEDDQISRENSSFHSHFPSSPTQHPPQTEELNDLSLAEPSQTDRGDGGDDDSHSLVSGLGESKRTQLSNDGTKYFKSFLTDAYSLKTAQPESIEIYSLQNIFRLVSDRLAAWLQCSEQEYQMTLPVKCWNGCGYETKFEEMTSHVRGNSCSHKPLICGDCSEVHPAYHMKDHLSKECVKRLIACPNTKIGCQELIPFHYLQTHINLRCQYRLAYCRLHCSQQIPLIKRTDHELNHCKKRLISCYQCHDLIPSEQLTEHMRDQCTCRQIQCTKGCYEYFNLKDIEYHEKEECIQPCKWKCGECIGPLHKRNLHELTECLYRPVECSRRCGIRGLTARNQLDHERNYCQYATLMCPNNCGEVLLRTDLYKHLDPWHGTCPERMVRCPSNLIGWRVLVNNSEEGIVMQYRRMDLSTITPCPPQDTSQDSVKDSSLHDTTSSLCGTSYNQITTDLSIIPSPDCGKYSWCADGVDMISIRFPNRHAWIPYWTSNVIPLRVQIKGLKSSNSSDGFYECHWICYSQLNTHLSRHCCNRDVLLGQANPLTELTYSLSSSVTKDKGQHHQLVSSSSSSLHCHEETDMSVITSQTLENSGHGHGHSRSRSKSRGTPTRRGKKGREVEGEGGEEDPHSRGHSPPTQEALVDSSLDDLEVPHGTENLMTSLNSFPGQHSRLKDSISLAMKRHEINEFLVAPPDKVTCEYCSNHLDVDQLEWHWKHDCTHILIRCQYGCGQKIPRRILQNHLEKECCKRNISCERCQEIMWADELEEHLQKTCLARLVPCPNHCRSNSNGNGSSNGNGNGSDSSTSVASEGPSGVSTSGGTSGGASGGIEGDGPMMIIAKDLPYHLEFCCENRLYSCECGESYLFCHRSDHLITTCPKKLTLCSQGCGQEIPRDELDDHMEYSCLNKHLFQNKLVTCPLRCGIRLKRLEVLQHVSYHCVMRLVECPLRCGHTFRKEKLSYHLKICPNRELYCEKGMPTCQFKLHQWFCHDGDTVPQTHAKGKGKGKRKSQKQRRSQLNDVSDEPDEASEDVEEEEEQEEDEEEMESLGIRIKKTGSDTIQAIKGQRFYGSGRLIPVENYASAVNNALSSSSSTSSTTSSSVSVSVSVPSHDHLGSIDLQTYSLAKISTSLIIQDNKLMMKDNLRLLACPSHGRNLLLYAVRFDETDLLKFIIHKTRGDDLDLQDRYGDTPLTLACRLQKIELIKLLIHYGADINLETVTGKTPLIEATKVKHLEIVKILITAGAIVQQKTLKHNKSALDWAKILQLEEISLYLELGSVVQTQIQEIFLAISVGNLKKVTEIIQEGVFFTPNNMQLFQCHMEDAMTLVKETKEALVGRTEELQKIEMKWKEMKDLYETHQREEEEAKERYQKLYQDVNSLHYQIGSRFEVFDKKVATVSSFDLEEIANMRTPKHSTRIASLAYGILFSILHPMTKNDRTSSRGMDGTDTATGVISADTATASTVVSSLESYEEYKTDIQSTKIWWPKILQSLLNKKETLKRLKTFSWVSLQSPHLRSLGMKIRELHREILIVKRREEEEVATATLGATAGVTTTATPVAAARPRVEKEEEEMVAAGATAGTSSDLVLNQEDWDSDADDGGDGEWVKGKWVGKVKKKSRWWEKVQEGGVKSEEGGGGGGGGEKEEKQQVSGYRKKRNRDIVRISEVLSQLEQSNSSHNDHENPSADHSSSQQIISTDPSSSSSSSASSSSQQQQQQQQHHTIPSFTLDLPFVDCMILLMSAVDAMLTDLTAISSLNLEVKQLKLLYDEKKSLKDYSKQKYETINSKYSMFQNEINLLMKKVSSNSQRIKTFKEKLRITRLLNHVTSSGHTVISWAACHGCYEMVELLLSKGATVGYNEELLHLSATVIQITFQIFYYHSNYFKQKKLKYRQELVAQATVATSSGMGMGRTTARGGGGGGGGGAGAGEGGGGGDSSPTPPLSAAELMNLEENQNTTLGHGVEELFHLKEQRSLLIFRINRLRRNFRFPVPEAAYCGHSDIIQRIHERKLLHFNFIDSWVYPSPPPPRIRQHFRLDLDSKKIPFLQILKDSKTHFSAGILTTHEGWLPRLSSQDPYLESSQELHLLYTNLRQHISSYRHHRHIVHMLHLNKLSQILHQQKMAFAIRTSNFKECVRLSCQEDLCSIDYEIPGEGLTALIVAAEENISGLHHQYLLNDDQQPVLAVCYLLDRLERAPGINIETSTGNTALLHACALGREHVVEALLDRYANINQQNCYGHAALHVAAINGSIRCTKLLLERGARSDMKDHNGKTPYDLALEHGFSGILTILGQYRGGYYGEITGKRGTINETIGCPSGCGVILHRHEIKDHLIECPLRTISCPLHCSDPHLIARDIQSHLTNDCPHRLLECSKCHQMIQSSLLDQHHQKKCPHRLIKCSLGCDSLIEAKELVDHQKTCLYKLIPCPELCGETYPLIKRLIHMRSECIHRRVCCPNQCSHLITFHTLTQHLHSTCPRRLLKCQWCHENIEAQSHIQHELHCSYRLMECENHCGEKIQLIQMSEHLQSSCVYRFIQCTQPNPNGSCEYKIREIDMFNHLNNECPNRIIFCPLGCMSRVSYSGIAEEPTRLVAKQLPLHLKTECLERLIHCGLCSLEMKAKDLPYHGRNLCEYRSCSCRNHGCCKVLRGQKLREKHERNECKYRFVLCPTGCGVAVIAKRLQLHMKSEGCPMRYVPCVLGCGLEIRQGQMGMHLQYECNKRQLQGTYGSRAGMPFRNQTSPSSPHRRNGGDTTSHSNSGISRNDSGNSYNSGSGNGIGAGGGGAGRVSSPGKSVSGRKDVLQLSTSSSLDSDSPISSSPSPSPATGAAKRGTRAREGTGGAIPSNLQLSLDNDHPLQSSSSRRRTMHDSAEGKKKPKKTDSLRSLPPI